jgi:hypothetical protein
MRLLGVVSRVSYITMYGGSGQGVQLRLVPLVHSEAHPSTCQAHDDGSEGWLCEHGHGHNGLFGAVFDKDECNDEE